MNSDIKDGAKQLVKGLKAEAKDVTTKIIRKFDDDGDGKIAFAEIKKEIVGDAKDGVDRLKALATNEDIPQKTKEEINKAIDKIKPMVEAAKMDAEIKKEKIEAEIEHLKKVDEIKSEVSEEAAELAEEIASEEVDGE